jgi:hypothetical protein
MVRENLQSGWNHPGDESWAMAQTPSLNARHAALSPEPIPR